MYPLHNYIKGLLRKAPYPHTL